MFREVVWHWVCSIQMNRFETLHVLRLSFHLIVSGHFIWVQKIPFSSRMMGNSEIYSKKYTKTNTRIDLKPLGSHMSTDWSMIWWHRCEIFGLVKSWDESIPHRFYWPPPQWFSTLFAWKLHIGNDFFFLFRLLNLQVVLCGLVKTMMAMSNLTLLLKFVCDFVPLSFHFIVFPL